MADYKINSIDTHNIREWDGPNGKVFYISVMLDGHEKWVSIGKKSADALKVGDTVSGEIQETEYPTDKFKIESNFKPRYEGPKRATPQQEDKRSDGMRQGMAMNNANQYVISKGDTKLTPEQWADEVHAYAQALYAKGDLGEPPTKEQTALEALSNA